MSEAARTTLGIITLIAILWDTAVTIPLLYIAIANRKRITVLEHQWVELNKRQKARVKEVISVQDITSIVQAGAALATAALTTYTLVKTLTEAFRDGSKRKSNVIGSSNTSDSTNRNGNSGGSKDNAT